MKDINCPYCTYGQNVDTTEMDCGQDSSHEIECINCEKTYVCFVDVKILFKSQKADCLNDGKHDFELTHTHPKALSKMRCKSCFDERELTEAEKQKYNIGTIEGYLNSLKNN